MIMVLLAIKEHKTRGDEVINILEMFGGKNEHEFVGVIVQDAYCVNEKGIIDFVKKGDFIVYTLEELFDKMKGWMFTPVLNTIMLIILILCVCIYLIINCTGVIKLWNKIRDIKL